MRGHRFFDSIKKPGFSQKPGFWGLDKIEELGYINKEPI